MDFVLAFLYVFAPIALARNSLGLKSDVQAKIDAFDSSFSSIFNKVTNFKPIHGTDYLANILGLCCAFILVIGIISKTVFHIELSNQVIISKSFVYTFIGYFSIKWYSNPEKFSLYFLGSIIQISAIGLLMPFIDIFYGIEYTSMPYNALLKPLLLVGIELPNTPNVFVMGLIISVFFFLSFFGLWLVMSVIMALYFLPTLFIMSACINICKTIEKYFGNKSFNAILIIIIIATQYYSWYKG